MRQGLVTRNIAPATSAVVSTQHTGQRSFFTSQPHNLDIMRELTYMKNYFMALTKDKTDWEIRVEQTPEQMDSEAEALNELSQKTMNAELLHGKPVANHEVVLEALQIYREHGNWKGVDNIFKNYLVQEQMYDYIDPVYLKECEDWLLKTHPRYILYNIKH